ncbi:MAG: DUF6142 family protein [Lachnospiraceae bacterium]|nr:DUF6142 family protein [Lachnospiraceae bacterium]
MKKSRLYKKSRTKYDARGGILSSLIAVLSICLFLGAVLLSVSEKGEAGAIVGEITLASLVLAFAGFLIGLASFKEKDKFERFSWGGSLANGAIMIAYVCMVLIYY